MSKKYCDISQFRVVSSKDTYYIFLYFDYYFCHLILMMNIHKTSKILSWIETLKCLTRKVDLLVAFFQEFNYSGKYRNQCASKYNQQYYCLLDIKLVFWSILVTLIRNHHTLWNATLKKCVESCIPKFSKPWRTARVSEIHSGGKTEKHLEISRVFSSGTHAMLFHALFLDF